MNNPDPIDAARNRLADCIIAASFEDDTVDDQISEIFAKLNDVQRLELLITFSVFGWERLLEKWGDPLTATVAAAQLREKLS